MVYTDLTRKAMIVAYNAHDGQLDKSGVPYIFHPISVAEMMQTEVECTVALLHDVVEDTNISFEDLEKEFPYEIIRILKILTRDKNVDYMEYIKGIKNDDVATRVKIADITHNSLESRLITINDEDIARGEKYVRALEYLKKD